MEVDGVFIEVKKLGWNSRRFSCKVTVAATLDDVWRVVTNYDGMSEILPCVVSSKIIERRENFARVSQVGQQDLVIGLKISPKVTVEFYERDAEILESGKRRELELKMVESDFQIYEGKWTIEQMNKGNAENEDSKANETTVSYVLEVKTKLWMPIQLIEGRLSKMLQTNIKCIRDEVMRLIQNPQPSL